MAEKRICLVQDIFPQLTFLIIILMTRMNGHYEVTYQGGPHCLKKKKVAGMKPVVTGKKEKQTWKN